MSNFDDLDPAGQVSNAEEGSDAHTENGGGAQIEGKNDSGEATSEGHVDGNQTEGANEGENDSGEAMSQGHVDGNQTEGANAPVGNQKGWTVPVDTGEWVPLADPPNAALNFGGRNGDRKFKYIPSDLRSAFDRIPGDNLRRAVGDAYDRLRGLRKAVETFPRSQFISATHESQVRNCLENSRDSLEEKLKQIIKNQETSLNKTADLSPPKDKTYTAKHRTEMVLILNSILNIGSTMLEAEQNRSRVDEEQYQGLLRDVLYYWICLYENMNALRNVAPDRTAGRRLAWYFCRGNMLYEYTGRQEGILFHVRLRRNLHAHNYLTPYTLTQWGGDFKLDKEVAEPNPARAEQFDPGVWLAIVEHVSVIVKQSQQLWLEVSQDLYDAIVQEIALARDADEAGPGDGESAKSVADADEAGPGDGESARSVADADDSAVAGNVSQAASSPASSDKSRKLIDASRLARGIPIERLLEDREEDNWDRIDGQVKELLEHVKLLATKDDLERLATKDDLELLAIKDDLEPLATKADVQSLSEHVERDSTYLGEILQMVTVLYKGNSSEGSKKP